MKRLILLAATVFASTGCLDDNCRQMQKCCAAAEGADWVGASCGDLARGVRDSSTCHTIVETIRHTYEQRGEKLPAACSEGK